MRLGSCHERPDVNGNGEKTHVFPVRAGFSLVLIRVITGGLSAVLGVLTWIALR